MPDETEVNSPEREPLPTPPTGLTAAEAARRLAADGPNELAPARGTGLGRLVGELVREPMIALLLVLVGLYVALGDLREAIAMGISVFLIIGITLFQEWRTERAVAALRDLASPRAHVVRDGVHTRIVSRELVRGDRILLEEGDRVPGDAILVDPGVDAPREDLHVDESLVTGESVPVTRTVGEAVLASTLVVEGRAHAVVTHTGPNTRVGRLGKALGAIEPSVSPLRLQIDRLVRLFGFAGLAACLTLAVGLWLSGRGLVPAAVSGIGLGIAMIPEEYPVILTVFLALGAWRMAREHVIVRRLPAIEALGAATVLCVDKTGTLTENRMRLTGVWTPNRGREGTDESTSDEARAVMRAAALASRRHTAEPMDAALWEAMPALRAEAERWELVADLPFGRDPITGRREPSAARVHRRPGREALEAAVKGAPEAVLDLAGVESPAREAVLEAVAALGADGLRVLAVGATEIAGEPARDRRAIGFRFLGLVGIEDPVRSDVPAAVAAVRRAGVRVLVITGDSPETARAIAFQAGLGRAEVLLGRELETLSEEALRERLPTTTVIARAVPEHKLRIVEALTARGDVVAMTGDGVNDALALRAAAIGIAMGGRGTDVAREAASIVLSDDRFASIVSGLRRGRRIFENLQRASGFLVTVHVLVAGLVLFAAALGLPAPLLPLHIVALELLIDPMCSVVFEAEAEPRDLMERPPRAASTPLLDRTGLVTASVVGLLATLGSLTVYAAALHVGVGEEAARFSVFVGLVVVMLGSLLAGRHGAARQAESGNRAFAILGGAALVALVLGLIVAPVREALAWQTPPPALVAVSAALSALVVLAGRWIRGRIARRGAPETE